MKLYIDSTVPKKVLIRLDKKEHIFQVDSPRNQDIFANILSVLEKAKVKWQNIGEIEVKSKGESFTGVRLGVAIANALAFSLEIKVNGQNPPLEPKYDSEPNITQPKSKTNF